jgi:3-deoxy-D-manno-octulosonic-acid transferase
MGLDMTGKHLYVPPTGDDVAGRKKEHRKSKRGNGNSKLKSEKGKLNRGNRNLSGPAVGGETMWHMTLYNGILLASSLALIPWFGFKIAVTGKYRKSAGPKLGMISRDITREMKGSPRIWVHAVSVGEVTAAAPIIAALRDMLPRACIVLSTSTETGQDMARRMVSGVTSYIYYPLDLPWVVRKVFNLVRPDIFVPVETELWPNCLRICRERDIPVVMVNGRISPRSYARYSKTRSFWRKVLSMVDAAGMISPVDAERIGAIGVDRSKLSVMGNAKYDSLAARTDESFRQECARELHIPPSSPVFVAGSTHRGEEEVVLNVYRRLLETSPDCLLIIVPRHIERRDEVLSLIHRAGFTDCITMGEIRRGKRRSTERVLVIDVIGELFKMYAVATAVYCGGSLVLRGGQNILEAAAWGAVVLYGPSMEDFTDERRLLETAGAGITVRNERELLDELTRLMKAPDERAARGGAGRNAVMANRGASRRYAELILSRLTAPGGASHPSARRR